MSDRIIMGYRLSVCFMALAGIACGGGRTPLLTGDSRGFEIGGTAVAGNGRGGTGGSVGTATTMPTQFTATEVLTALANCGSPHGSPVNLDTGDQEAAHLVGSWIVCPSSKDAAARTMFAPAIQFRADGTFNTMVLTDDGGLQMGTGLAQQGKWSAFCEMSSDIKNSQPCHGGGVYYYSTIYVWIHVASGDDTRSGCAVGPVSFESSPTRAYVIDYPGWCDANEGSTKLELWMVPLP